MHTNICISKLLRQKREQNRDCLNDDTKRREQKKKKRKKENLHVSVAITRLREVDQEKGVFVGRIAISCTLVQLARHPVKKLLVQGSETELGEWKV